MNYVLANVWRGESDKYFHDQMSRLRFLLVSAVETSGGQEKKDQFLFCKRTWVYGVLSC